MTLARCVDMGPDDAREMARTVFAATRQGKDPAAERITARQAPTMRDLRDRYMSEHADRLKPGTRRNYELLWDKHIIPRMGSIKISEVQRENIAWLHAHMSKTAPTNANRGLEVLTKAFALAELWRWRPDHTNPCRHIKANSEAVRERVLTPDEIKTLWAHLDTIDPARQAPVPVLIRLLMLTGCRVSEWRTARWEWVDLDAGTLSLPDSKTGAKTVVLSDAVCGLLAGLKRLEPYVLPGRQAKPVAGHQKAWQRIRKACGLEGVRLHDLRHTVGTHAAASGLSMREVADLLGHKSLQSTQRYVNRVSWLQKTNANRVATIVAGV